MIQSVETVGWTVSDMQRMLAFYTQVLPCTIVHDHEFAGAAWEQVTGVFGARVRVVTLTLGSEQVQLTQYLAPPGGRAIPPDSRSNDRWFQHIAIVVSDIDAAYAHLREHNVQHVSTAPQTLPAYITAAAGVRAFYFRDPDGHNLELIWFPADKGSPRWQQQSDLFLGIDHTAIAVGDTARSLSFYRAALGLTVAGSSENYGSEQEHLNMVFGARVQITGLHATGGGIGVEFLQYRAPPGGRPMPADTHANDLWYWEITVRVAGIDDALHMLAQHGMVQQVGSVAALPANPWGYRRAVVVRDPDGHALRLVEADSA